MKLEMNGPTAKRNSIKATMIPVGRAAVDSIREKRIVIRLSNEVVFIRSGVDSSVRIDDPVNMNDDYVLLPEGTSFTITT